MKEDIYAVLVLEHLCGYIDINEYIRKIVLNDDQVISTHTPINLGYNTQYYTDFFGIIVKNRCCYFISPDMDRTKILELYNKNKK